METLPTNFQDAEYSGLRKYRQINNDDGTVSFQDVTDYTKKGSKFGANEVNAINLDINEIINRINMRYIDGGIADSYLRSLGINGTNTIQEVFQMLPNGITIIQHNTNENTYTMSLPKHTRGQVIYYKFGDRGYIKIQYFDKNELYVSGVLNGIINTPTKVV